LYVFFLAFLLFGNQTMAYQNGLQNFMTSHPSKTSFWLIPEIMMTAVDQTAAHLSHSAKSLGANRRRSQEWTLSTQFCPISGNLFLLLEDRLSMHLIN
jgi:hypothetical protein